MDTSLRAATLDDVLLLQLENPDGYPRLTRAVLSELDRRLDALLTSPERHKTIRAIVIIGTPEAFAAGADIEEVAALTPVEASRFSTLGQSLMSKVERFPLPVIAAIRGYCLGGGLDLALSCRTRIAAGSSIFGHPGGSLGIITGWGGTARLPRLIGRSFALDLLTSGRTITADEAFACGLVSRVVSDDEVLSTALSIARKVMPEAPRSERQL